MATGHQERPWVAARALALAKEPGLHRHPTEAGFFIRVSPQLKAVWGYRFRDCAGKEQSGTLGALAGVTAGDAGLELDEALDAFKALRSFHGETEVPGKVAVARQFDAWTVSYKRPTQGTASETLQVSAPTLQVALDRLRHRYLQTALTGGLTVDEAFSQWIREHKKKGGGDLAGETLKYYQDAYERGLKATLGSMRLETISTNEWMQVLGRIKERSPTWARGTMWLAHAMYKHFIELDMLDKNPLAKQIVRNTFAGSDQKKTRKSHVKALDIQSFVQGIDKVRRKPGRVAMKVMLLTGWRLSAVLRMRWACIDANKGVYNVAPGEVGWKGFIGEIALSDYALAYLDELRNDPRYGGRTYVFEARHGDKEHMTEIRGSIKKAAAGLGYSVTPHDLRRTFVTIGNMVTGGDLRTVGFLVGHRKGITGNDSDAVTAGYAARNLKAERIAANAIGEAIMELAGELPMSDETAEMLKKHGFDPSALMLEDLDDDDDAADEEDGVARGIGEDAPADTVEETNG